MAAQEVRRQCRLEPLYIVRQFVFSRFGSREILSHQLACGINGGQTACLELSCAERFAQSAKQIGLGATDFLFA